MHTIMHGMAACRPHVDRKDGSGPLSLFDPLTALSHLALTLLSISSHIPTHPSI
jgi:hypothetical protein